MSTASAADLQTPGAAPEAACADFMEVAHEAAFKGLTQLAQQIFGVGYASVAIQDGSNLEARSHQALPVQSFARAQSFSGWVITQAAPLIVPDAMQDDRFTDNSFVRGLLTPHIRFYAGAPVWLDGRVVGAFSLIDETARMAFDAAQLQILISLADQVSSLLKLSRDAKVRQSLLADLEHQRRHLELMQEMTHTGYYRFDFKTRMVEMSKGIHAIYSLPLDSPPSNVDACMAMIVEPDRAQLGAEIERARQTGSPFTHRMQVISPGDQSLKTVISKGLIEYDELGEEIGLFAIVQDITEDVARQRALDASQKRLEMMETATEVGFWYQKLGYPFLEWSPGIYAILEEDPETFVPQHETILSRMVYEEDRAKVSEAVGSAVRQGLAFDIVFRIRRRSDQTLRHVRNIGNVERDGEGRVVGLFGIALDVTDAQNVAEGLRQAKQAAEALNQAKSDFIANISHDLRTPLTTISGYADILLQDTGLGKASRGYANHIAQASQTLSSFVSDILDASRFDKRQMDLTPGVFDLREMFFEISAQAKILLRDKPVVFADRFDGRLAAGQPVWVFADSLRLRQVVQNLMANACKFTQTGQITLWADFENDRLSVSITDTGAGIDPALQPKVFERFIHADSSLNRAAGGSGLGLSIAREVLKLMGGEIGFESEPDKGSRFSFPVPLRAPVRAPENDAQLILSKETVATEGHADTVFRVLIVDDHGANRELLRLRLLPLGAEVDEAHDGAEAIERAKATAYDAIFMDIQMPVMDGLTAMRAIRTGGGPNADTPIVALSAMSNDRLSDYNDAESARGHGFDGTLTKPIDTQTLIRVLAELC
jgi:signal transduction histidine kinase/ActR/RegA family two-component response regulator